MIILEKSNRRVANKIRRAQGKFKLRNEDRGTRKGKGKGKERRRREAGEAGILLSRFEGCHGGTPLSARCGSVCSVYRRRPW